MRAVLGNLGLTSNQVWGLTKTDDDWSAALEGRPDGNPAGRPQGWYECRMRARLRLQRVP
jgi:hypothetical protein